MLVSGNQVWATSPLANDDNGCNTSLDTQPKIEYPKRDILFALKSNLLFDALLAVNFEVEVPIGNRWSVAGEWITPWWISGDLKRCYQVQGYTIEGRYWLGDRKSQEKLTGWAVGFYLSAGYYDLEWEAIGYQGEYFMPGGVSGTYAHTIGYRFRMEYSLGVGAVISNYRKYNQVQCNTAKDILVRERNGRITWVGVTRARVSISMTLGRCKEKGAER
ncbi:MAG: DUF3575 domain-containing protein [Rikenellaceae bacterium]